MPRSGQLVVGAVFAVALAAAQAGPAPAQPRPATGAWGVDLAGLSQTVRPGDDFYRYVNEGWLARARIPPGMAEMNVGAEVYLRTETQVRAVIEGVSSGTHAAGSPEQQIADFARSRADVARLNALGLEPIRADLDAVRAIRTRADLARLMGRPFQGSPIVAGVLLDPGNPRRHVPAIAQGGLTMPDRDYYLSAEEPYVGHRAALRDYAADLMRRAGVDRPETRADEVLAIEVGIARAHWSGVETRDRVKMYDLRTLDEIERFAPGFEWRVFLAERKLDKAAQYNLLTNTAVQRLARLYAETPLEAWRSYMLFHVLDGWAGDLGEAWQEASFGFHQKRLMGVPQRRPLADRTVQDVNAAMAEQIGRIYARQYFRPESKAEIDRMVRYMRDAYRERIGRLDWMDDATRAEALAKLDKIVSYIGYPDRWHDLSPIRIAPDDLVGNRRRIAAWKLDDELAQLNAPRRDWEWPYPPQEVNAGYMAVFNSITFPAGILQPPFFDPGADPAVNYGAIAAVIGHELGHAFDDQGSRSDGDGRLRDWWTSASRAQFEQRTARLVAQYDQYSPAPGVKLSGRLTLGENIGDLGGLSIAYDAYRRHVREQQGGAAPVLDGFTGDQRFFLSWAQIWRSLSTPEDIRRRALTDNHSPGEFRTNGIVRNLDAWYAAFGAPPDAKLYLPPEERVRIW
ncbi:MAG: M13 family metallopeptidase [Phenylobacterium sp.]|uniref:M13 family metallopeptidase n=1 Tax=Phenylobacterium sp. TaxID=1871053 RepID=UPI001A380C73|nr:M13 family metallopeptidase [Phenylobacterium sp.]MBL8771181.1 M13 family metallopeptidase [Phenylobacterium sp.]